MSEVGLRAIIMTVRQWQKNYPDHLVWLKGECMSLPELGMLADAAESAALSPRAEEIEVWHVEYWDTSESRARVLVFVTKRNALDWAANFLPRDGALPRVTGPHKHMRPL